MRKFLSILLLLVSVVTLQAQPTGSGNCSANFTATVDGFVVSLSGTAAIDSSDFVTEWFWSTVQGMATSGQNVALTIPFGSGVYNICLFITTNDGCQATYCQDIVINDDGGGGVDSTSCNVWAGFFATTNGTTTTFNDFSSSGNTSEGVSTWTWDFGDGNVSTVQNPSNEYAEEGTYTVCLTVTDAEGCEDTNCQDIVVGDVAIGDCETIANGSSPYAADDSTFLQVIAMDSYCCTGVWDGICQDMYDEIAGGGSTDSLNCEAYFYHTADTIGNGGGIPIGSGLTVSFWDASGGAGDWSWDFGNGEIAFGPQQTYTYEEEGTYTVCLTISNDAGCTSTYCEDIVVSEWVGASCLAAFEFYHTQGSNVFSFDFIDWSSTDVVSWDWDFGDGNFSSEQSPSYVYADYGEYMVCLTVTTEDGCSSVLCQALTIVNPADCEAHFWHSALPSDSMGLDTIEIIDPGFGGLTVTFLDCSIGSPDSWTWDFGNGETASGPQQTYTYEEEGVYTVCLTIANAVGCESVTCQDIYVEEGEWGQCYAEFSMYSTDGTATTPGNIFQFEDWSSDDVVAWQWDFGDGTSSQEQNPIHTYQDGTYTACLTVVTADGCVSEMCTSLVAGDGGWQPTGLSICGSVNVANNFNVPTTYDATVYLIEYDAENNTLTAVDSTIAIGFGWGQGDSSSFSVYCFDGLEEGSEYLVKAAMNTWSPLYNDYLPTYYEGALSWMDATTVVVNDNVFGIDINMVAGDNPGGPGFIGGNISEGAGKSISELGGIMVILFDENGNPVSFTHTDEDGNYSFEGIAYGSYSVHIEILNIPSEPFSVTISADVPSFADANFVRESGNVSADFSSSIEELILAGINDFNVKPNPVQGQTVVSFNASQAMNVEFQIFNIMGQRFEQKEVSIEVGANSIEVDASQFAKGIYLLQLSHNGQAIHQVKMVKD